MNARALSAQPWRFLPGDTLHVRGWAADQTVVVTDQRTVNRYRFPHYLVVDSVGGEWLMSQLQLSRSPVES